MGRVLSLALLLTAALPAAASALPPNPTTAAATQAAIRYFKVAAPLSMPATAAPAYRTGSPEAAAVARLKDFVSRVEKATDAPASTYSQLQLPETSMGYASGVSVERTTPTVEELGDPQAPEEKRSSRSRSAPQLLERARGRCNLARTM